MQFNLSCVSISSISSILHYSIIKTFRNVLSFTCITIDGHPLFKTPEEHSPPYLLLLGRQASNYENIGDGFTYPVFANQETQTCSSIPTIGEVRPEMEGVATIKSANANNGGFWYPSLPHHYKMSKSINGSKVVKVVQTDIGSTTLSDEYYASFLSQSAKERNPSPICSLYPLERAPGMISLLAGKPNPTMFPITSLSFSSRSPHSSPHIDETTYSLTPNELGIGLQYGDAVGIKFLRDWLYGLQEINHGRKRGEGWGVFVGTGSQDLIFKAVHALVNDGDPVLIESSVYSGVIPVFESLHCDLIEVNTDDEGISATSLRSMLEGWPVDKLRPKVLYSIPYGCNPTGITTTLERRIEVLKLAREFDLIILEHDPYFYIYYGTAPRPPSYFALEKEWLLETGRVLRFDSFSNILSAGMRIGFASGPEVILGAIERHTETTTVQTPSLTQIIVAKLLDSWRYDGFKAHTERVSKFYREKRDVFQAAMMKYLNGYAEWVKPEAGMFFWFKLNLPNDTTGHEENDNSGDSESIIQTTAFEKGVLALPGKMFLSNGDRTVHVRASFSLNTEEEVVEALKRLRAAMVGVGGVR